MQVLENLSWMQQLSLNKDQYVVSKKDFSRRLVIKLPHLYQEFSYLFFLLLVCVHAYVRACVCVCVCVGGGGGRSLQNGPSYLLNTVSSACIKEHA